MPVQLVEGDLLEQPVEALVNAWNRNIIPWWLLIPQGVSGALKKRAGTGPFRELARFGPIPLGKAVHTSAGKLSHRYKALIHVAGINMLWRSSPRSIEDSVRNAVALAKQLNLKSIAMPLIGAGSGGGREDEIQAFILGVLADCAEPLEVRLVRYRNVR